MSRTKPLLASFKFAHRTTKFKPSFDWKLSSMLLIDITEAILDESYVNSGKFHLQMTPLEEEYRIFQEELFDQMITLNLTFAAMQ
jgi:hypothetical protein